MAARNTKTEAQALWSSETAARFDIANQKWIPLPNLPERRSSHDSVVVGDVVYVMGGWVLSGGGSHSSMPKFHDTCLTLDLSKPGALWQVKPQPFKRRALATQAIGTKIYAIGGMDDHEEPTTSVDVLDTSTGEWTKGPQLPADKLGGFGYAAAAHEGRLFASGVVGIVMELKGDSWESAGVLEHPRFFHRIVPAGPGKLLVLGGENRNGEKAPPEIFPMPSTSKSNTELSAR
jgi:N-acetylneuraminic acid mutarotase